MTKTIDDIIWEIYEEGIKAAFNGSNKYIGTVRSEAKASLLELIKEAEPENRPQTIGNKTMSYINRKYIDGEVNGYNKGVREYTSNLNQLFKKEESNE